MHFDWAAKWAYYLPEKVAIKEYESGRTFTYGALNEQGNQLAYTLQKQYGIKKGDRIAILADNSLEHLLLLVAAQKTGFILVPLNYRLAPPEIGYLLKDSDPALLVVEDKYAEKVRQEDYDGMVIELSTVSSAQSIDINQQPTSHSLITYHPSPDDPILILYTSGTTGFPKGAMYTYKMMFWNSINTAMSLIINNDSRTINCMPLFHTGGWNVLMTPFFHHGGYTCLLKKFEPALILDLLVSEKVSIFMGVPTMLKMIADLPNFSAASFPDLYYIIVGGEPMPIPLIEKWHEKNVPIRQGYGMTEVGPNLTSLHHKDVVIKKGSIGKPNFYVSAKIVAINGQEAAPGQAGELLLKGPMVTPGYWRNDEATQKSIEDGWFHSGDMAIMDEDGYLFIVDRIKNMYISGGENVYPAEVERVLLQHPNISEAAVIGVPDAKWGETGKAFIVATIGSSLDEVSLQAFCRQELAGFKRPKYFEFIEALPKNDTGKINRKALK